METTFVARLRQSTDLRMQSRHMQSATLTRRLLL